MNILGSEMFSHWILQTIAMLVTAGLIPRLYITSFIGAFFIVVALSFVNATIWDAALFFSIPNHITSHALLLILSNGIIFYVLIKILPGIEVQGILPALAAPLIFTIVNIFITQYAKEINWIEVGERAANWVQEVRNSMLAEKQIE